MIKIPTPEEVRNIIIENEIERLSEECISTIKKYYFKPVLMGVEVRAYQDNVIDIVIKNLNTSGWATEVKIIESKPMILIKEKNSIKNDVGPLSNPEFYGLERIIFE
jgi:hypothetical protein